SGSRARRRITTPATARWRLSRSRAASRARVPPSIRCGCCGSPTDSADMDKLGATDLMSLEQYARERPAFRARVLRHKGERQLAVGPTTPGHFGNGLPVQSQGQEILRPERILEPQAIAAELGAYNPLIPDGSNWK